MCKAIPGIVLQENEGELKPHLSYNFLSNSLYTFTRRQRQIYEKYLCWTLLVFHQTIPIRKFWNEQMVSRILTTAHKSNAHMYEHNVLSNIWRCWMLETVPPFVVYVCSYPAVRKLEIPHSSTPTKLKQTEAAVITVCFSCHCSGCIFVVLRFWIGFFLSLSVSFSTVPLGCEIGMNEWMNNVN